MSNEATNDKAPTETAPPSCAPSNGSVAVNFITPDEAYERGWAARMLGKTKATNPYLWDTDPWMWFNAGWDESEP